MLKLSFLFSCLFLGFFTPGTKAEELYEMQYLDHFNTLDDRKFKMTYTTKTEDFKKNGPLFVRIQNSYSYDMLKAQMNRMAEDMGAFVVQVPMRFQEDSLPEKMEDSEIIKYVSIEQKLEDVIHLVKTIKKKNPSLAHSKVIVFGTGISGNLAVWLREKYPHIIDGAVALNSYIDTRASLEAEYETIANNIKKLDPQCYDIIKDGIKELAEVLKANNTERISKAFNFCSPQSLTFEDFTTFLTLYLPTYSKNSKDMIETCDGIKAASGTPLDKIGTRFNCRQPQTLHEIVEVLRGTIFSLEANSVCTQYGHFLVSENPESLFGNTIPMEYYTQYFCPQIFGKDISGEKILRSIERTREKYGGDNPDVTKVMFIEEINASTYARASVRKDFTSQDSEVIIVDISHPDFDQNYTEYNNTSSRVRSWLE